MAEGITIFILLISSIFLFIFILNGVRNRSFYIFISILICFILWTIFNYFSVSVDAPAEITLWMRLVMIITSLLFLGIFELANYFPENQSYLHKNKVYFIRVYFLLTTFISSTSLVISSATNIKNNIVPLFGPLIPIYAIGALGSILIFAYIMFRKYRLGNKLIKRQIRFIGLGLLITGLISIVTNFILVLIGNTNFVILGPLTVLIFLSFIFALLLQGGLFSTRIVLGKIIYYLVLISLIIGYYFTTITVQNLVFENHTLFSNLLVSFPLAVFFIIFYNSTNKFIREKIDSTLISPDYDPTAIISEYNNEISTVLNYKEIAEKLIATYAKTIRTSYEGVVLFEEGGKFEVIEGKKSSRFNNALIQEAKKLWSKTDKETLNLDILELELPDSYENFREQAIWVIKLMKESEIKLVVPLGQKDNMLGMVLIGKKEADSPFNSVEINFINSLADSTSLALARSMLYREVQEFNDTLQAKIKEATSEIQDKNAKLEEALRIERDMLDVLGHELRTPLGTARNAILVVESLMEKNGDMSEDLKKYLTVAVENIRREVQLLETILASTKIDNHKLELKIEEVDVEEILNNSHQSYQIDAEKKGLDFVLKLPSEALKCKADKLRVQQILDNLVSNAIKYTEQGSVSITAIEENGRVKFSIIDTGEGIPSDEIPKLGKKFYRVNNYLTSNGKLGERNIVRPGGTGIGLYVVFQLIKAMNGELKIESEVGKGSIFSFFLPKA